MKAFLFVARISAHTHISLYIDGEEKRKDLLQNILPRFASLLLLSWNIRLEMKRPDLGKTKKNEMCSESRDPALCVPRPFRKSNFKTALRRKMRWFDMSRTRWHGRIRNQGGKVKWGRRLKGKNEKKAKSITINLYNMKIQDMDIDYIFISKRIYAQSLIRIQYWKKTRKTN